MNSSGDIALGYSASDATTFPSIRYTGRLAGDPLGQMTFAEQSIIEGTGYQSGSAARWGDYSMMSVDPTDDATFWYTTEYIQTSGTVNWKTRIASFNFAPSAQFVANITKPCLNNTTVFTDQSLGIPTSWSWTVSPATFAFMDATNSTSQNPHIKFTALGNYTIALTVTNARGSNTITKAAYISVNAANADFAATSTSLMVGNPATFNDASTCSISSWSWDFGAGGVSGHSQYPGSAHCKLRLYRSKNGNPDSEWIGYRDQD
jgi:PKD repeat protein